MSETPVLNEFEQVVLFAIMRLGAYASGVTIREEIAARTEHGPAPGALYTALDRLEDQGFITSRLGDAISQRGDRAKHYFQVSATGVEAVKRAQRRCRRRPAGLHAAPSRIQ